MSYFSGLVELRGTVRKLLPEAVWTVLWPLRREMKTLRMFRLGLECPICGNNRRFIVVNTKGGAHETLCLRCMSLERHRRTILLLRRYTNLYVDQLRVLHVAPEACLRSEFQRLSNLDYLTGDLFAQDVDVRLDLTALEFRDSDFDVVLCSHVLEHIPDDMQAMREIRRVVKPDGWALINVPADPARQEVYEDPSIVDPAERLRHFGQEDHVRIYSTHAVVERLSRAGFDVTVDPITFTAEERRRYLLTGDIGLDRSYFCVPTNR